MICHRMLTNLFSDRPNLSFKDFRNIPRSIDSPYFARRLFIESEDQAFNRSLCAAQMVSRELNLWYFIFDQHWLSNQDLIVPVDEQVPLRAANTKTKVLQPIVPPGPANKYSNQAPPPPPPQLPPPRPVQPTPEKQDPSLKKKTKFKNSLAANLRDSKSRPPPASSVLPIAPSPSPPPQPPPLCPVRLLPEQQNQHLNSGPQAQSTVAPQGLTAVQQLAMQQMMNLSLSQMDKAHHAEFDPHIENLKFQIQAKYTDEVSSGFS